MTTPYKPVKADSEEWVTPDHIWEPLHEEFNFTIDVAASDENAKCLDYYTKEDNALVRPWYGRAWCNPPYSAKMLTAFADKAIAEAEGPRSVTTVMLVPPKTDQAWWHRLVAHGAEFRFVLGRVKFVGAKHSAPDPSVVVVVRPRPKTITGRDGAQPQGGEG